MNIIDVGYASIIAPIVASPFRGLGYRFTLKFEDLETGKTNMVGPIASFPKVLDAIHNYSKSHQSFNIYNRGRYVGGTEV